VPRHSILSNEAVAFRVYKQKRSTYVKKIILAVAVAATAVMALAASASAGVERYQTQSMTITAVQPEGAVGQFQNVWTHTYTVELNPCDGSFSGVGSLSGTINGFYSTETIAGHLDGGRHQLHGEPPRRRRVLPVQRPARQQDSDAGHLEPVCPVGSRVQGRRDEAQLVELQEPRRVRQPGRQQG
jgi:hypothetical protein